MTKASDSIKQMAHSDRLSNETRATKRVRLLHVLRELTNGTPQYQIRIKLAEKWGCSEETIRNYILECRSKILPSWYDWADIRSIAAEMHAKLERVYAEAMEAGRFTSAMQALKMQLEVYGITSPAARSAIEAKAIAETNGANLDEMNTVRAAYGQRKWDSIEEYQEWVRSLSVRKLPAIKPSMNGVSN